MRHYDTSYGPINVLRTNEKGWRTRIRHQTPMLSSSGVAIPLVKLQCGHFTNGIATPLHDNIGV